MKKREIGIIGLGTMGQGLALNFLSKGIEVSLFNRSYEKCESFIANRVTDKQKVGGYASIEQFINSLEKPRKILLMVPEKSVDDIIEQLFDFLDIEDIIIDGGNSHYLESVHRQVKCKQAGIYFISMGISGGEKGAMFGPSLMPSGDQKAYNQIFPLFEKIAAKANDGQTCICYIGNEGSGHFVKMVHNGIEYADLQIICEMVDLLRNGYGFSLNQIADLFEKWNESELKSYLLELTVKVLRKNDINMPLIDLILDKAEEKGTGKWSVMASMEYRTMVPSISEAVNTRFMSTRKDLRKKLSTIYNKDSLFFQFNEKMFWEAFCSSRILIYAQGFDLLNQASRLHDWNLNLSDIALIWREGCIIRSDILILISNAYKNNITHLLEDEKINDIINKMIMNLRRLCQRGIGLQLPIPVLSASLQYFDGLTQERNNTYLLQSLRDAFGSHGYERIDRIGHFHSTWED